MFLRSSSYEKCDTAAQHKPAACNAKDEGEQQHAPKEAPKQLDRLRLDDGMILALGLTEYVDSARYVTRKLDGNFSLMSASGSGAANVCTCFVLLCYKSCSILQSSFCSDIAVLQRWTLYRAVCSLG